MFCTNCGQELSDDDLFCTNCGAKTTPEEGQEAEPAEAGAPEGAEGTVEVKETQDLQKADGQEGSDAGLTKIPDDTEVAAPTNVMPAKETTVLPSEPAPQQVPAPQPQQAPAADVTASYPAIPQQPAVVAAPPQQPKPSRAPLIVAVSACVVAAIACVVMVLHVTGAAPWVSKQAPEAATTTEAPTPAPATPAPEAAPAQQQPTVVVQPIVISTDGGQQTTVSNSDYMLPDSASHYYSESSLSSLSNWQLFVARNEIYARHGRRFLRDDLQSYFNSKSWYHGTVAPENFNDGVLNDVERANALTMRTIEESRGSEYLN